MAGLFGTRAQIAPIKQTAIQPTGIPGSTFVRAPQKQAGSNLNALASALGSLNSALQNFAGVQSQVEEDPQSRDNREWVARRQQMSLDQLRDEAKNETPDGIRVREDALNLMLGERANDDFRKRWMEFYNTEFDRTSGDAAGEYEKMRQDYAAGLPTEIAKGNFYRLTKDHFSAWMEKDTEEKVTQVKQELNTTVTASFRNAVDDAINLHGKSPEEAAQLVFSKSAANRDFLGLSPKEQNDTVFALAQEYADQGNEAMVKALLNGERKGADGRTVPALIKIPAYADGGYKLIEQANSAAVRRFQKDNLSSQITDDELVATGAFTKAEAEKRMKLPGYTAAGLSDMVKASDQNRLQIAHKASQEERKQAARMESSRQENEVYAKAYNAMMRMGGVNNIHSVDIATPSGDGTKPLSAREIIDKVIAMREGDFSDRQEDLIKGGMKPEEARERVNRERLDWYAGNKIVNRAWDNTLNGIAGRAGLDTMLQKGEVSQYLKDSAKLYRDLRATNPAYLSTVVTDKASREFLETYDNAIANRRMTEDDALVFAAQSVALPENLKAKSLIPFADAEKLARRTLRGLDLDDRSSNRQFVLERINSLSSLGLTKDEIKDRLESDIKDTAVPIHGMLVFEHRDLPDDFPDLMEEEIMARFPAIKEQYGITDPDDLFVVPDGGEDRWYIASKSLGGMPVQSATPITSQTLTDRKKARLAAEEAQIRKLVEAKDAERETFKRDYQAGIQNQIMKIQRYEKEGGAIRMFIAKQLRKDLQERMLRDQGIISAREKAVRDTLKSAKDGTVDTIAKTPEWLRSLIPQVVIGDQAVIDGWRVGK